ncbi:hypothetical protein [Pseudofulvibacter geojedonensis]|uniref:Uncharacterized protein n=1 Tax=Pseudofulvibacter geojedonensis TaxID=1123758 RepID=A0ABW3I3P4_9FLAO
MSVETKPRTNTVTLENAKKYTEKWQIATKDQHCKAFLIPALDLSELLKEMEILKKNDLTGKYELDESKLTNAGVRGYLGIDSTNGTGKDNGYGEKMLFVGTDYNSKTGAHNDIILNPTNPQSKDSGIYDFTYPCPSTCDINSELYHEDK